MKRTKKIKKEDGRIWFKKIGRGSLRIRHKIIKPGQEFQAYPEEISENIRDVVIPLENVPEEESLNVKDAKFELKHRGGGYYDVVHADSQKKVNEKALRKKDAEDLIKTLE